jgi:histidinol-phosphatase (PHP family)
MSGKVQYIACMTTTTAFSRVSVHGGHSGQFCHHARDSLEAVVQAYVDGGFLWAGITEHMPPLDDSRRYPDEVASGIAASSLQEQFLRYFAECERLREQFAGRIRLFKAFETESYPGSTAFVQQLIELTRPDYIVGSVHHVGGIGIDFDAAHYAQAVAAAGDIGQLYCDYFDDQFCMLEALQPAVVGHFDLIRIFDPGYLDTLQQAGVQKRITRNLELMADLGLIMDFNLRGFDKSTEQYPCMPVLRQALALGVCVVPGDDSHGVSSVGRNYDLGLALLRELGHDGHWREPRCFEY